MSVYHGLPSVTGTLGDIATKECIISPGDARHILAIHLWKNQRGARKNKVSYYSRMMKNGEWAGITVIRFAKDAETGNIYLIDGQHRLAAVADSGVAQKFLIIVEVAAEDEIPTLYANIDRGLTRTPRDQYHAYGIDSSYGWSVKQMNAAITAVRFISFDLGMQSQTRELSTNEMLQLIEKYGEFMDIYMVDIVNEAPGPVMKRAAMRGSVIGVATITLAQSVMQYGDEKVMDFWNGSLSGIGLSKNDPRLLVNRFLRETTLSTAGTVRGQYHVTPLYTARYLGNCFNAWVTDRKLSRTFVKGKKGIVSIHGSMFDGKSKRVESVIWG